MDWKFSVCQDLGCFFFELPQTPNIVCCLHQIVHICVSSKHLNSLVEILRLAIIVVLQCGCEHKGTSFSSKRYPCESETLLLTINVE